MIDRILVTYARFHAAWMERKSEREFAKAMKKRGEQAGWFVAVAALCLSLPACAHVETTRDVITLQRNVLAECVANLDHIAETATSVEAGDAALAAEGERCKAALLAICTPRHTCPEGWE